MSLLDWEKTLNTAINKTTALQRVITQRQSWMIMHTDYRRPLPTFATTISAVGCISIYAAE